MFVVPTDRTRESTAEADQHLNMTGGADPGSRVRSHLANERTFLAWLRTGLALIVVGIGAAQFLELDRNLIPGVRIASDFAAMLILVGTLTVIVGRVRYMQSRDQIDRAQFHPAGRSITTATALIAVIGVLSIALVYLMGRS
jgi:putative membrane protein